MESYIHRTGRTGRAGLDGKAITFVTSKQKHYMRNIMEYISYDIPVLKAPTEDEIAKCRAGTIREDLYDLLYDQSQNILNGYTDKSGYQDERFLPIIYEIDKREEFQDEACWEKANPSLDHIKDREALRYKVNKAIENPMLVKNLLCKDFNVRETSDQAFLTFEIGRASCRERV